MTAGSHAHNNDIIMMLPHRPNGDSKSRLFAPLVRMGCPTELSPLARSLYGWCSDFGIVPTRSFSNTVRPPSHAAAFINASITLTVFKGTDNATRVSETLSPLALARREIKDLESRLRCRTVPQSSETLRGVCALDLVVPLSSKGYRRCHPRSWCLNRWDGRGLFFA